MLEIELVSAGVSGYLLLLCVLSGLYLLIIDARPTPVKGKEQSVSKVFGWIHLVLSFVILLLLWLL